MTRVETFDLQTEQAVYLWFKQKRLLGQTVSCLLLQEKARLIYTKLTQKEDFLASNGWLEKFKKRHGIKTLTTCGERVSAQDEDAKKLCVWFSKYLVDNNFDLDNVYNADETGFFW